MRELVFALEYEPGCNAVADALADHPDAQIESRALHATTDSLWRVDCATGPPAALDVVEDAFRTSEYYAGCLATEDCGATQQTEVLERREETLVLYSYWERTKVCSSVPHLALEYLGEGILFETRIRERRYTWRIVHSGTGDVRGFFDALEERVGDRAGMDVRRLTDVSTSTDSGFDETDGLPPEQAEALEAAVELGYYETPREIDGGELADRLDLPRSTLTYRLRRAEAYMAEQQIARSRSSTGLSTPE